MAPSIVTLPHQAAKQLEKMTMLRKVIFWVVCAPISALTGSLGIQALASSGTYPDFTARVIHVQDGDTVEAMTSAGEKFTVRLASIDAPETFKNRCKPGQPFAQKSKDALSGMVLGKSIKFVCHDLDRYGRQVCDLQQDSTTASRELVRAGLAWANTSNPRYLRDKSLPDLESQARLARRGMWSTADNVAPWEWRRTAWRNTCQSTKGLDQ